MRQIMRGEVSPAMIAALIVGLRVKKETIGEIAAAAQVMREFATQGRRAGHRPPASTSSAPAATARTPSTSRPPSMFVAAAAGARVAKHGGRSRVVVVGQRRRARGARRATSSDARSRSRSRIDETGIGFMFAPNHHAAMKHAAPVRKELGVRTIFNILGPLTNPAGAPNS